MLKIVQASLLALLCLSASAISSSDNFFRSDRYAVDSRSVDLNLLGFNIGYAVASNKASVVAGPCGTEPSHFLFNMLEGGIGDNGPVGIAFVLGVVGAGVATDMLEMMVFRPAYLPGSSTTLALGTFQFRARKEFKPEKAEGQEEDAKKTPAPPAPPPQLLPCQVTGFSAMAVASTVEEFNGFQFSSLYNEAERLSGAQLGVINRCAERCRAAAQLGLINYAAGQEDDFVFQFGALNIMSGTLHGVQLGVVNVGETGFLPLLRAQF